MKNKHNDQTVCLKCSIKPNRGLYKEPSQLQSCGDCDKGVDPIKCEDCGIEMVYCGVFSYYHSIAPSIHKCNWFGPKEGVKETDKI